MDKPVLKVKNLKKTYKFVPHYIPALSDVSFDIFPGEVVALLGLNGAGKTTTVKIILNFISADSGETEIFGVDSRFSISRERLSYLPEKISLQEELTPSELFEFLGRVFNYSETETKQKMEYLLEFVKLNGKENLMCGKFSKGMLQRLGLAMALFHNPEFLILDEPLTGLDPLGMRMVEDVIIEKKKEGITMLICSHELDFIERTASKIIILHEGKVLSNFAKKDISVPLKDFFFKVIAE
ncbi:MAG: ABC transporter ATP-binding protein [Candidatus Hydrogenedentota bacterium]